MDRGSIESPPSHLPWWKASYPAGACRDSLAQTTLVSIILVFAVGAVFGQMLYFGTVWDDQVHLTHPLLTKVDLAGLMQTWQQGYEGLYIPLSYTILGLVGALSANLGLERAEPTVLHALSFLLHSINVLLVYRLLRRLHISLWPALSAALLFAIHPLQVESVVWISEIRGLLAFALGVGALLLSLHDVESLSRGARLARGALASLLFALAMLAKPSAIVMPLFLMLIGTLGLGWSFWSSVRRAAFLLLLAVVLGVATATIQGFNPSIHTPDVPLGLRPLVWMDALASYIRNLLWPAQLCVSPGRTPNAMLADATVWWTWLIPVALAVMAWTVRHRDALLSLGILLFFVGSLPNAGFIPFTFQDWSTVADRYLYWSMAGAALVFARAIDLLPARAAVIFAAIVITVAGLRSALVQVPTWRDDRALWSQVVKVAPMQSAAWSNLANYLPDETQKAAAIDRALALDPENEKALNERGLIAWQQRADMPAALKDFERAVATSPGYLPARLNRAAVNHRLGRLTAALADLDRVLAEVPQNAPALLNRGLLHIQLSDLSAAEADLVRAVALDPNDGKALEALAIVALLRGDASEARTLVQRAEAVGFQVQPNLRKALDQPPR